MILKNVILGVTAAALTASVATAQTTYAQRHSIRARQANQQRRIDQGVRSGQITPAGAAAAERRQAHISSQENAMRAADGGHLTAGDRHQLAREQNHASRNIYNRKHNLATDPGVAPNLPR